LSEKINARAAAEIFAAARFYFWMHRTMKRLSDTTQMGDGRMKIAPVTLAPIATLADSTNNIASLEIS
jgi:hypothetical protein